MSASPASSTSVERYTGLRDALPGAYVALTICAHISNRDLAPKEPQGSNYEV